MGIGKGDIVIITISSYGVAFWTISLALALWVRSDEKRTLWRNGSGVGGLWQACGFNSEYRYIPHVGDPPCISLVGGNVAGWIHTVQGFACVALLLMAVCLLLSVLTSQGYVHYDNGYPLLTVLWLLAGLLQIVSLGVFASHLEQGEQFYQGVVSDRSVTVRTYLAWPFYLAGAVAGVWNVFSLCLISAAILVMMWQQRNRKGRSLHQRSHCRHGSPLDCGIEHENLSGDL